MLPTDIIGSGERDLFEFQRMPALDDLSGMKCLRLRDYVRLSHPQEYRRYPLCALVRKAVFQVQLFISLPRSGTA